MPPRTLTRQEFLGRRPGGNYAAYLNYLRRNRPARMAQNAELAPYRPMSPGQIDEATFRDVLGPAQAQLDELGSSFQRRSDYEAGQIQQRVGSLTSALLPFRGSAAQTYGNAQASLGQLGSALTAGLASHGQQMGTELGQKLRAINAPNAQVGQVAGGAETTGYNAGQAVGGLNSAEVERLRGEGAATDAYMAKMPGLVQLMGADQAREVGEKLALELADQEGGIRAKVPGLLADARRWYMEREDRKADSLADARAGRAKAAADAANEAWDRSYKTRKLDVDAASANARLAQGDARVAQGWARIEQQAARYAQANAQAWARIGISDRNSQLSASRNELQWEKYRNPKTRKDSGITPAAARQYARDAGKIASQAWNGVKTGEKDDEGVPLKDYMSYQEAMREGLGRGIPLDVMQRSLNRYWTKPGMHTPRDGQSGSGRGRPKVPFQLRNPKGSGPGNQGAAGNGGILAPASFKSTHRTDNLGWPAVDIMGKPGTAVGAPVDGQIVRHGSAQGGQALYFRGNDGSMYWLGHIDSMAPVGTRVKRGQNIASISADHPAPHLHIARRS